MDHTPERRQAVTQSWQLSVFTAFWTFWVKRLENLRDMQPIRVGSFIETLLGRTS